MSVLFAQTCVICTLIPLVFEDYFACDCRVLSACLNTMFYPLLILPQSGTRAPPLIRHVATQVPVLAY